jgi:hypothetical protein
MWRHRRKAEIPAFPPFFELPDRSVTRGGLLEGTALPGGASDQPVAPCLIVIPELAP